MNEILYRRGQERNFSDAIAATRYTHQQTKRVPQPFILGLVQLVLGSNPLEMEKAKSFLLPTDYGHTK